MLNSKQNKNSNKSTIKFWKKDLIFDNQDPKSLTYNGSLWKYSQKRKQYYEYRFQIVGNKLIYYKDNHIKYRELDNEFVIIEEIMDIVTPSLLRYKIIFKDLIADLQKEFFITSTEILEKCIYQLKFYCIFNNFLEDFQLIENIGQGGTSKVLLVRCKKTKEYFAAKSICKIKDSKKASFLKETLNEINILRTLKHPKIPKLHAVYKHEEQIIIVHEYLSGGTISEKLARVKKIEEKDAALIMKSILEILIYLEKQQIVHRDIKLDNIVFAKEPLYSDELGQIKLIDFGLASKLHNVDQSKPCGTPGAIAPEILELEPYGYKVDVFSAGVSLYTMLSGSTPFKGKGLPEILDQNYKCELDFTNPVWENISSAAKQFLLGTMARNPTQRYTALDALNNPWIQQYTSSKTLSSLKSSFESDPLAWFNDSIMTISLKTKRFNIINDIDEWNMENYDSTYSPIESITRLQIGKYALIPKAKPI